MQAIDQANDPVARPLRRELALLSPLLLLCACVGNRAGKATGGLHYEARQADGWSEVRSGEVATSALGATVRALLHPTESRLELRVENPTAARLDVRVGPEATRSSSAAIGEVQHRRLDGARGEGTTDFLPYLSMQPTEIAPGEQAAFFLDNPLGREPALGHYFVLVVELQSPQGVRQRRLLPLVLVPCER